MSGPRRLLIFALTLALHGEALAQAERAPVDSVPLGLVAMEGYAFASAAIARSERGARVVGAVEGVAGLTVLGIAAFSDRQTGRPEFAVPYGVGLLMLSAYNFDQAASPDRDRRFWTNAIGVNAVVVVAATSAYMQRKRQKPGAIAVHVTPSGLFALVPF
jgi:hypothetical protein